MERINPLWALVIMIGIPFVAILLLNLIDEYEEAIKKNLRGLGIIIGSIISILFLICLFIFAIGTIGDFLFQVATVIQNNIGRLLLAFATLGIVAWILKKKGEST